jgi:glucose-1-phosphate cytidylyltransferase
VLDYLADGDDVNLEHETLPRLAAEGELIIYRHPGFWRSMDTFKEALELDSVWRENTPWKVWE